MLTIPTVQSTIIFQAQPLVHVDLEEVRDQPLFTVVDEDDQDGPDE